eukprot:4160281-Amphidinium_carterae.1
MLPCCSTRLPLLDCQNQALVDNDPSVAFKVWFVASTHTGSSAAAFTLAIALLRNRDHLGDNPAVSSSREKRQALRCRWVATRTF